MSDGIDLGCTSVALASLEDLASCDGEIRGWKWSGEEWVQSSWSLLFNFMFFESPTVADSKHASNDCRSFLRRVVV
jgi:hypothetical protein